MTNFLSKSLSFVAMVSGLAVSLAVGCGTSESQPKASGGTGNASGSSSSSSSSSSGAGGADAGPGTPIRTLTTRPLLPTAVNNLLLDPFVTGDEALGHFLGAFVLGSTSGKAFPLERVVLSRSPIGVTAPIVRTGALSKVGGGAASFVIIAPFPGGSTPFSARIWVSAGDVNGAPVAFDKGSSGLVVALQPNDKPNQHYVLERDEKTPAQVLDQWEWVRLELKSGVDVPEGGWFTILVNDENATFRFAAPEVTPNAPSHGKARSAARGEAERAAIAIYSELHSRR
jgi:hypothetical protein